MARPSPAPPQWWALPPSWPTVWDVDTIGVTTVATTEATVATSAIVADSVAEPHNAGPWSRHCRESGEP